MKAEGLLVVSVVLTLISEIFTIGGDCGKLVAGNMFDLNPLKNTTVDYVVPLKNATDERVNKDLNLNFNFCGPAIKQCTLESNAVTKS